MFRWDVSQIRQRDRTYICNDELDRNLRWGFRRVKLVKASPPTPHRSVIFLLTVPRWFLCCSSSLYVCRWSHTWSLFCYYNMFFISPSFGASWELCFVIVAFPMYSLTSPCSDWINSFCCCSDNTSYLKTSTVNVIIPLPDHAVLSDIQEHFWSPIFVYICGGRSR